MKTAPFKAALRACRLHNLSKPGTKCLGVLEPHPLGLVVLEVVVRVALLLHEREAKHDGVVEVVGDG